MSSNEPHHDAARLEAEVRERYARVAESPAGQFPYAIGRAGAVQLGYRTCDLAAVPTDVLDRFVGVGCPFAVRRPGPGERVLDIGCGAGTDVFVARALVGDQGASVGIDLSPSMVAIGAVAAAGRVGVRFEVGSAAALPFADASFDQAISNGAFNLVVDKDAALRDLARVLAPGGWLAFADLLVTGDVPEQVIADKGAWSA